MLVIKTIGYTVVVRFVPMDLSLTKKRDVNNFIKI